MAIKEGEKRTKPFIKGGTVVALLLAGPWLLLYIGLYQEESPAKPLYTYGEFPFYLKYEINNVEKIVNDTVIVEFDGYGLSEGSGGKYVKWKQTLASGLEDVILYNEDSVKLIFTVRSEDYRLEDEVSSLHSPIPDVVKKTGRMTSLRPLSSEELQTDFKMKLITFKYGDVLKK